MNLEIHVYHHLESRDDKAILAAIRNLKEAIMSVLTDLQAEVAENKTVMGSAVVLLEGLKVKLDDAIASGDPAALTALSTELDANTNALATAVAANTPADPNAPA